MTETEFRVRYSETDQMGVVHHRNYFSWFEVGRTEWIREKLGMSYADLEKAGLLLPLYESSIRYKSPAKYDDIVVVKTTMKECTNVRIHFYYEVYKKGTDERLVIGETKHAWTNKDLKPVSLKKHHPSLHNEIKKLMEE
ncbi:acyl-CoA thioesterase [Massilibacterium senegalense]|uniref:acyl-CoA thioesterase n=1 Tax=Massilibacterium senegalense TaxID=1632858 RepID=UPI0007850476|nr:thioesterase family protein [Massilibacterium senegalense]